MISDQIEALRKQGQSDEQIALLIRNNNPIDVTSAEIAASYATSEQRHQNGH
jgi:hypothetical protein